MYLLRRSKGITLIALVVTLVILIILAAVSINMILGEQGIFSQAKKAINSYQEAEANDLESLENLTSELDDKLARPIPIKTAEQLLKMGTGEKVEIEGTEYYFNKGRTYVIQNNIEYTGSYDNIAELIKNEEIQIQGNGYKIIVTNGEGKKEYYTEASKYYIATNSYGYVLKGLELFFDGKDNAGEGVHDNTATVWKDLSGNNRDGTLNNFGTSAISGWNNDYLSFDGVNDWVSCGEMNFPNVTIESVHRIKSAMNGDRCIVGNWEDGGNGIFTLNGTLKGNVFVNTEYHTLETNLGADFYKNQIMTQSLAYNGQEGRVYINGEQKVSETLGGDIENPKNNTIMVIGTNAYGNSAWANYADIDVYTVRIYNRGLTQEEIEINKRVDSERFKNQEKIPVYTAEQLLKIGSGEQVIVEQENKTYTYGVNAKYELKNDITVNGNYSNIMNKINNKEVEIVLNDKKISHNGVYYTANSKYTIGVNQYGYVVDGLQLLYDGMDNTGKGMHDDTASVWKDLSGNNRDGTLTNMDVANSWQEDGLKFDGIDDFVLIAEMNYDNVTLEAVSTKGATTGIAKQIVSNINTGGYDLYQSTTDRFAFQVYIAENVAYVGAPQNSQSNVIDANIKYSLSGSYDGNKLKLRTSNGLNGATTYQENETVGTIGKPTYNTYMALGANLSGTQIDAYYEQLFDGIISSVRIYNKALSDEENAVNYLNDRERYQV